MQVICPIRKLQVADLKEALALILEAFLEFEAPEYSLENIQEFKDYISIDNIFHKTAYPNRIDCCFFIL